MKGFLLEHAFGLVSGAIVAPIVLLLGQYVKRLWGWLDAQNDWVKRGAVTAIAAALNLIAAGLGVALPQACQAATDAISADCRAGLSSSTFLGAVVSAALAMVLHKVTRPTNSEPDQGSGV